MNIYNAGEKCHNTTFTSELQVEITCSKTDGNNNTSIKEDFFYHGKLLLTIQYMKKINVKHKIYQMLKPYLIILQSKRIF